MTPPPEGDEADLLAKGRALSSPLRLRILRLCLHQARTNKEIASDLGLTERTVKHYMTVLMQKLNVRNRVEVAIAAQNLRRGLADRQGLRPADPGRLSMADGSFTILRSGSRSPRLPN